MQKIIAVFNTVETFAEGRRTQIAAVLMALVQILGALNVLTPDQVKTILGVLLPLAGATLAAKIGRVGQTLKDVVGPAPVQTPPPTK